MSEELVGFPPPAAPTNPVLSCAEIAIRDRPPSPNVLDSGRAVFTTSGRAALAAALQCIGIDAGDEVLLPAYHCPTMVAPVTWLGARARFYDLPSNLALDVDHIESCITAATRAVLAVHYFGFVQDLRPLRALCDDRGLMLIEDCAHTFFGGTRDAPVGSVGDYSVASLMKFFPVFDGGCLVSARHDLSDVKLRTPGLRIQLRAAANTLDRAVAFGRFPPLGTALRGARRLRDLLRPASTRAPRQHPPSESDTPTTGGTLEFDPEQASLHMSAISRHLFALTAGERNVRRRQKHYRRLLERFASAPGMTPLYPSLLADSVPYVFPLLVDAPDPMFRALRREALPLLRWEFLAPEVDASQFPVSAHYSRHLIQIPCHQSLTETELDWMADRLLTLNPWRSASV